MILVGADRTNLYRDITRHTQVFKSKMISQGLSELMAEKDARAIENTLTQNGRKDRSTRFGFSCEHMGNMQSVDFQAFFGREKSQVYLLC